jgi:hypothetical protein
MLASGRAQRPERTSSWSPAQGGLAERFEVRRPAQALFQLAQGQDLRSELLARRPGHGAHPDHGVEGLVVAPHHPVRRPGADPPQVLQQRQRRPGGEEHEVEAGRRVFRHRHVVAGLQVAHDLGGRGLHELAPVPGDQAGVQFHTAHDLRQHEGRIEALQDMGGMGQNPLGQDHREDLARAPAVHPHQPQVLPGGDLGLSEQQQPVVQAEALPESVQQGHCLNGPRGHPFLVRHGQEKHPGLPLPPGQQGV